MPRKKTETLAEEANGMTKSVSHSDVRIHCYRSNSLFNIPGLFVGFNAKGLPDGDSVRSPRSPLDFMLFSYLNNPIKSPQSLCNGRRKNWGSGKVGLSIIDSLDDDKSLNGGTCRSFEKRNIFLGPIVRVKHPKCDTSVNSMESPKSLPKDYTITQTARVKSPQRRGRSNVVFEIGDTAIESSPPEKIRSFSLDSCTLVSYRPQLNGEHPKRTNLSGNSLSSIQHSVGRGNAFSSSLSKSEIALSEDYTCIISHGPNSKTTHIFGDCILECHPNDTSNFVDDIEDNTVPTPAKGLEIPDIYSANDFLSFCFTCKKPLREGEDIFIYRGEKAFCSLECRTSEILLDGGETEVIVDGSDGSTSTKREEGLSGSFAAL